MTCVYVVALAGERKSIERQQKLADYEQYQRTLRELYEQYAQSAISEPGAGCDRAVAIGAITAGYSEQETIEIVRQGDTARAAREEFGQREELELFKPR